MSRAISIFAVFLALASSTPAPAQDTFTGVQRIVAMGDIHGDYDRLVAVLHTAGLIDRSNAWSGGTAHLVLCGDMVDRGPASRKVLDLVMTLQTQAAQSGGAVHPLIGNHEVMNMIGDNRYVSKEDWASYRTPESSRLLSEAARSALETAQQDAAAKGAPPPDPSAFLSDFTDKHPVGWVEHYLAFGPKGKYGQWLRQQKVIIKINECVFMHAGIPPNYADFTREEINRKALEAIDDSSKRAGGIITTEEGPLWYRDFLTAPESTPGLAAHVDHVLGVQEARHIIVGHSVQPVVAPHFGGKVIGIDVGMSAFFKGPPEFLVIEGSKFTVICRGEKIDFPSDGRDVMGYLRMVAKADPQNQALLKLISPTKR